MYLRQNVKIFGVCLKNLLFLMRTNSKYYIRNVYTLKFLIRFILFRMYHIFLLLRYPQQNHKFHSFIYIQVTAKDFLAFPSPSKLLQLGSGRAQALKEELGVSLLSVLIASSNAITKTTNKTKNNKSTVELNNELIVQYFYQHCYCMEKDNHYVAVYIYMC